MEYKIGSLSNLISGTQIKTKSVVFQEYKKAKPKQVVNDRVVPRVSEKKINKGRKRTITEDFHGPQHKKSRKLKYNPEVTSSLPDESEVKPESILHEQTNSVNAEKRIMRKSKIPLDPEKELRTIFVKNLPNNMKPSKIEKLFKKYGEVESVRLRCAPLADPRVPKKVAIIKSKFHPERSNICAFICFTSPDSVTLALEANGMIVADHHIMVDKAVETRVHDQRKAIFVGNVPFSAEEDELWKLFESCGNILDVRIIRDRKTGIGKGFAYINFESPDAVELALNLNGACIGDRELRISRILQKKKLKKGSFSNQNKRTNFSEKHKDKTIEQKSTKGSFSNQIKRTNFSDKQKDKTMEQSSRKNPFQGMKIPDKKMKKKQKKNKLNKAQLKKKIIMKKLTHITKKQVA